jgi:hypothetical protein
MAVAIITVFIIRLLAVKYHWTLAFGKKTASID